MGYCPVNKFNFSLRWLIARPAGHGEHSSHPAPIPGRAFPGARDARDHESHPDVRAFTTDVLTEPVEWTGKVRAELYVSSTAPDADFIGSEAAVQRLSTH